MAKQTKEIPQMLKDAPPLPMAAAHIWSYFCELRSETPSDQKISIQSIQAIEWMYGVVLSLWEKKAIKSLDNLYFRAKAK